MFSMFVQLALYVVGGGLLIFLIYSLFFAGDRKQHEETVKSRQHRRFERREHERGDRRQRNEAPPEGVERRKGPRRN